MSTTDRDNSSILVQRVDLAREGFTVIRNVLRQAMVRRRGVLSALFPTADHACIMEALELAEALHNLPRGQEPFQEEMTYARLRQFVTRYPNHVGLLRRCWPIVDDNSETL
ncbi:MAG: hypothetical protein VR70_10535 [Rhodospirillaceae bacterium BRH_c57]|nr:MAG: hypothetical protein VR70_10535 [Rhodospirillaceae bacterium BRH_c57]